MHKWEFTIHPAEIGAERRIDLKYNGLEWGMIFAGHNTTTNELSVRYLPISSGSIHSVFKHHYQAMKAFSEFMEFHCPDSKIMNLNSQMITMHLEDEADTQEVDEPTSQL